MIGTWTLIPELVWGQMMLRKDQESSASQE